jgi:SHS2 domain-containing protein
MSEGFEEVEHTSDVALRVWGRDLPELFANAARGMAWLLAGPATVVAVTERSIELTAQDAETLLVSWLGELLYLGEEDGIVFVAFELEEVTSTHLQGSARGGTPEEPRQHIKAVTFSEMEIRPGERGLETKIVFDV